MPGTLVWTDKKLGADRHGVIEPRSGATLNFAMVRNSELLRGNHDIAILDGFAAAHNHKVAAENPCSLPAVAPIRPGSSSFHIGM